MAFQTTHIRKMITRALDDIEKVQDVIDRGYGDLTVLESTLNGAMNKLDHAAAELRAECLEHFHGISQV